MTTDLGYEVCSAETAAPAIPDVVDADGLIDPSIFPLRHDRMDLAALDEVSSSLRTMATAAVDRTDAIAAAWAGLQGCYSSPEAPAVYALMVPAQTAAGQVAERLRAAAGALDRYADALGGGFKTRLKTKVEECEAFRTEALAGVWIQVTDTNKASFWDNLKEVGTVGHYDKKVHVSWKEDGGDGGMVDRNEQLREDYAGLVTEAFNLAAACADEIAASAGLSVQMAQMLGVGVVEQITAEDLLAAWGPAAQEDRNCVEQTGQGFADFGTGIWDGGRMLVGYDPTTGKWSWGTAGQAWGGVGNLVGSVVVMAVSLPYAVSLPVREALGQDTYTGFDNWMYERAEMTASLVGYDPNAPDGEEWHSWEDEPWRVGTTTVTNIATIAVPGAGAVGGGVKGASTAAKLTRAASMGARGVAEVLAPGGSWAVRGAGMLGRGTGVLARGQGWAGALDAMRVASGGVRPSVAGIGAGTAGAASDLGRMTPPTTMHPDVPSVSGSVRPLEVPRVQVPEVSGAGAGPSRVDAGAGAGRGADGASVLDDAAARESWLYQEAPAEPSAAARAEGARVGEAAPVAERELVSAGAERAAGQSGSSAGRVGGSAGEGPRAGADLPPAGRGPGSSAGSAASGPVEGPGRAGPGGADGHSGSARVDGPTGGRGYSPDGPSLAGRSEVPGGSVDADGGPHEAGPDPRGRAAEASADGPEPPSVAEQVREAENGWPVPSDGDRSGLSQVYLAGDGQAVVFDNPSAGGTASGGPVSAVDVLRGNVQLRETFRDNPGMYRGLADGDTPMRVQDSQVLPDGTVRTAVVEVPVDEARAAFQEVYGPDGPGLARAPEPDVLQPMPDPDTAARVRPQDPDAGLDAEGLRRDPNTGNQTDRDWQNAHGQRLSVEDNAAVQAFAADAIRAADSLTPQMESVVGAASDARLVGLDNRVKFASSLKGKVAGLMTDKGWTVDRAIADVNDSVRFTVESPPESYSGTVRSVVDGMQSRGLELVGFKNTWGTDYYRGINSTWRDPTTGTLFEVQFHTPESFVQKDSALAHGLYEHKRVPGLPKAEVDRLTAQNSLLFRSLPVPPGATGLSYPPTTYLGG